MTRRLRILVVAALITLIVSASALLAVRHLFAPTTVVATFSSARAIYVGDEVRIAGVPVGTIVAIRPAGTHAELTLEVDHGVRVPAEAKAVMVAPNLVSARFVQLTPAYSGGPVIAENSTIPIERTAVPVEWDEVKEQLTRLATDLGPQAGLNTSSIGRLIDSAAGAMDGNGQKLRDTLRELSGVSRILADGSSDIGQILENLQKFVAVLRQTNQQIVQFQDRFATLTSVLDGGRSDLDAALNNLSVAVADVRRFVAATRDRTADQVHRLTDLTQIVADRREDLEQVLHVAPNAIANSYNMMDPRIGGATGVFVLKNMAEPTAFLCGMISAVENVTAPETSKLCAQYLGPALNRINFNNLPFPVNPLLTAVPPESKLIYTDPALRPGGPGTQSGPMAVSPSDSAYADQVPPPPPPGTPTLPQILLPAERPSP
ncbi:MCE family protein [Mycobacterium sp. MBM]|nr:MCE family protein [Mycobacterium sp. MBM]